MSFYGNGLRLLVLPSGCSRNRLERVDQDPRQAMAVLQHNVLARAHKKQHSDGLVVVGLAAAGLYLLSGK